MLLITNLNILFLVCWIGWLNKKSNKQEKEIKDLKQKYYYADRDIKTLHYNQKMLQFTLKELYRDLKIYGEVKKSRVKGIVQEKTEES